jgi:hypothetical protein
MSNVPDPVVLMTAVVGAITGTIALAFSAWNLLRDERTRVKVDPNISSRSPRDRLSPRLVVTVTNPSPLPVTIEHAVLVVRIEGGQKVERPLIGNTSMQPTATLAWQQSCTFKPKTEGAPMQPAGTFDHGYVVTSSGLKRRSAWMHKLWGQQLNEMEADVVI